VRKRIALAIVAVVVIGVGAYLVSVFSGPKRGSVEWHKREYLEARKSSGLDYWLPRRWREAYWDRKQEARSVHLAALIELGYVERRSVTVSKCPSVVIENRVYRKSRSALPPGEPFHVYVRDEDDTNHLEVRVAPNYFPIVERTIRELEAYEGKWWGH